VRKLKKKTTTIKKLIISTGHTCNDQEIVETLADTFAKQFEPNISQAITSPDININLILDNYIDQVPINPSLPILTNPKELQNIIKNLKPKHSSATDNISNIIIKRLPLKIIISLTGIINAALHLSYFPNKWKVATIVPILKKSESRTNPVSYRPISLLPSLSKIYERIILKHLNRHLTSNNILINEQFGFRRSLSCTHQLYVVTEHIRANMNLKKNTGILFLDIQKAFDKVWIEGLVQKLITIKIPPLLVKLLFNYLSNRSFRVKYHNTLSSSKPILAGVPQGSVLGPTLFNIFINDLPTTQDTSIALFADDTALYSSSARPLNTITRLQRAATAIEKWCLMWRIKMNPKKSIAIMFGPSCAKRYTPIVKIKKCKQIKKEIRYIKFFNQQILWKPHTKYLGVTLDKRLNWKYHIKSKSGIAFSTANQLAPILKSHSVSLKNKVIIYKQAIRPILTYACPAWSDINDKSIKRMEAAQNKILRLITNSPPYIKNEHIRNDLNIPTIKKHVQDLTEKFLQNPNRTENSTIAKALDFDHTIIQKKIRPPNIFAFYKKD